MEDKTLYIIAHNIRSAHNVGAIFRSGDGAGVAKIYLTGYSQRPAMQGKEEKDKPEKMLAKTALGSEHSVPWEEASDIFELIADLKKEGVRIVALEKTKRSVDVRNFKPVFPMALVLGHEVDGVVQEIIDVCDGEVDIPMRGKKESLNVSVAAGIAVYEILR